MRYINNNGVWISEHRFAVAVDNRGYLYGDGLFESIRVINGKAVYLEQHYNRLRRGMKALRIACPRHFDCSYFSEEIEKSIEKNNIRHGGKVRFSVDRMGAAQTYTPSSNKMSYCIEATHLEETYFKLNATGFQMGRYSALKKECTALANHKTKNGLLYVMAKISAKECGFDEVVIQNTRGEFIEGASSNLFVLIEGILYTPGLDAGPLDGTMRKQIIDFARDTGIPLREQPLSHRDIMRAETVFFSNAIQGVRWVATYENRQYTSGITTDITNFLNQKWAQLSCEPSGK